MNITKSRTSRKKPLLVAGLILLLGLGVLAVLEKAGVTNFIHGNTPTTTGPTKEEQQTQQKVDQENKQKFIESPDPTPTQPSAVTLELSAKQEPNGSVTVLSKIHNAANGTCTLTITNGAASYTQTADIIYQPDFSSCAGFSVPKEKLGSGEWTIKLSVNASETVEKVTTLTVN